MKYALWLANAAGMTGQRIRQLLGYAGSAEALYWMDEPALEEAGLDREGIEALVRGRKEWNLEERYGALCERGISIVSSQDVQYPARLRNIHNPPFLLYYKGSMPDEQGKAVAIVGARGRSEYGRQFAGYLAKLLAEAGVGVVSGLARGIDADGHLGALEGGGRTYAVLGCGVDTCYPRANRYLYERILQEGGGILSEYAPGREPRPGMFPLRNRIISGLSDYVVVVEARKKSGSLITADYALEQGREVYAVPGRVTDALSEGCNRLIAQGAGILSDAGCFVREVSQKEVFSGNLVDFRKNLLEKDEGMVYSLLDFCPTGLGTIVEKTGLPLGSVLSILERLEQKEFVRESIPNYFVRKI